MRSLLPLILLSLLAYISQVDGSAHEFGLSTSIRSPGTSLKYQNQESRDKNGYRVKTNERYSWARILAIFENSLVNLKLWQRFNFTIFPPCFAILWKKKSVKVKAWSLWSFSSLLSIFLNTFPFWAFLTFLVLFKIFRFFSKFLAFQNSSIDFLNFSKL